MSPILGRHPGRVTSQAEVQAQLFAGPDLEVRATSSVVNRPGRLVDVVASLLRWRRAVDVVVISVFSGAGFVVADVASHLCRRLGLPVVFELRGGGLPAFGARHPQWVAAVMSRGAALMAPSNYLLSLCPHVQVPRAIIPHTLDLGSYLFETRSAPRPHLLWLRAFSAEYRPELAVDVLAEVADHVSGALLTMGGQPGPALQPTRARARALGVDHSVEFAGFLDPEQKRAAFSNHDVFLSTSAVDNAPVTALEAAASGLPIVAFAVGGIPHLFDNYRTALLVGDGDVSGMANAVRRLLDDPSTAVNLAQEARRTVQGCDVSVVRRQWLEVLQSVVTEHSRR